MQEATSYAASTARSAQIESVTRQPRVVYSTLSAEEIEELAVSHYDLPETAECIFFARGVSDTYLLNTHNRRFALKVYRSNWRSRDAIAGELRALKHLDAKGVEVALPVSRSDGDWITDIQAPEGRRSAVLFYWADGDVPKYTNSLHAYQFGQLVARLHLAADDLPFESSRPTMDMQYLFETSLERIRTRIKAQPQIVARLEALERRVRSQVVHATRQLGDWGFCHGDIWAHNARVDNGRLVLFDFDFCGPGWRISDLASYFWEARRQGVQRQAWEPFLEGYQRMRPDIAKSLKYLGLFMILRHLWTISHWINLSREMGVTLVPEEFLENMVPFCEGIETDFPLE